MDDPFTVRIYFHTIFSIIVSNWARLSFQVMPQKWSFFFSVFKVALAFNVCYSQPGRLFLQKCLILLVTNLVMTIYYEMVWQSGKSSWSVCVLLNQFNIFGHFDIFYNILALFICTVGPCISG